MIILKGDQGKKEIWKILFNFSLKLEKFVKIVVHWAF